MIIHPRNLLLAILLAVLVVANLRFETPTRRAEDVEPLFPGFTSEAAHRITITVPDEAGPRTLELRRADEGWVLPDHGDFPAQTAEVEGLLARVTNLSTVDRLGTEASSHALFGVTAEAGRRLRIETATGEVLVELLQGEPQPGARGSHVRPLPRDAVFRTTDLSPLVAKAGRWIDTRLVSFVPGDVQGLSARLMNAAGEEELFLDLLRLEDGRWRSLTAAADPTYATPATLDPLFTVLASLYFRDVASETVTDRGFSPPHVTVELDVGGDQRTSVWIGALADGDVRYATDPHWGGGWTVTLPAASAERLARVLRHVARSLR